MFSPLPRTQVSRWSAFSRTLPRALGLLVPWLLVAACGQDDAGTSTDAGLHADGATDGESDAASTDGGYGDAEFDVFEGATDAVEGAVPDGPIEDVAGSEGGDAAVPEAFCPAGGIDGRLRVASVYWAVSPAYGDHYAATVGGFNAVHVSPESIPNITADGPAWIVDVMWWLFDVPGQVASNVEDRLDVLEATLAGKESRVLAFYVYDEPYLNAHATSRTTLEQGIAALKAWYPAIPTYLTFAHHCFDPSAPTDPACDVLPAASRGVPSNVDWVAFDWYTDGACGGATDVAAGFDCAVVGGVARMKALTSASILIVPEAFDMFLDEAHVLVAMHLAHGLALSEPRIHGLDYFLYATVPNEFRGLADMPLARTTVRALNREILTACGEPSDGLVPVFEWWHAGTNERDYRGGYWSGWRAAEYDPQGVRFGLRASAEPGTVPMYRCDVAHGAGVDHGFLTVMSDCEGMQTTSPPTIIGHVDGAQKAGLAPLRRFLGPAPGNDHYYTTGTAGPPGYVLQGVVGYVTPGSSL